MTEVTPELLGRWLDSYADALELYATQWSTAPADVVQDAFVELARQKPAPQNVQAWLYKVVRNRAISEARSATRRKHRESVASINAEPLFRLTRDTDIGPREATEALSHLPDELREILVGRIWGGLTFEQLGEITATSVSTAYRRYEEAIGLLRKRLGIPCPNEKTPTIS